MRDLVSGGVGVGGVHEKEWVMVKLLVLVGGGVTVAEALAVGVDSRVNDNVRVGGTVRVALAVACRVSDDDRVGVGAHVMEGVWVVVLLVPLKNARAGEECASNTLNTRAMLSIHVLRTVTSRDVLGSIEMMRFDTRKIGKEKNRLTRGYADGGVGIV